MVLGSRLLFFLSLASRIAALNRTDAASIKAPNDGKPAHNPLICQVMLNHVLHEPGQEHGRDHINNAMYTCHPVFNGTVTPLMYELNDDVLTPNIKREHHRRLMERQDMFISIPAAILVEQGSKVVVMDSDNLNVEIVQGPITDDRNNRQLQEAIGTLKVLVLRIISSDSEPSVSAEQLYNLMFVDDISMKNQFHRCSFGKLNVEPTRYGVLDVPIKMNVQGLERTDVVNKAYQVAPDLLRSTSVSDVREIADAVMFVLPPGTAGSWTAFGTIGGKQSMYNDRWASYIGATMHEIGHNLGMYHANEPSVE